MTRFLLYSHDTYGLGHLRRSTLLADAIVRDDPEHDVLIVTGSPSAQAFRLPERVDTLKLPSATKDRRGAYRARKLATPLDDLVRLRSALVLAAVESFEPDVVLVDHAPTGMAGELVPVLERFGRRGGRRLVLGLRDIIDDAERVADDWSRNGTWRWLRHYDDILVYGDPHIRSTATELGLASMVGQHITHTGYVAPVMPDPDRSVDPYLLVTAGGGGDGQRLLRKVMGAVERGALRDLRTIVVTGPLMSAARRDELADRAAGVPSVEVTDFREDMRSLIASASGVISMAGYNTVVEELAAGVPALLVPRDRPRLEQTIRARRVARRSALRYCPFERLDDDVIDTFVADIEADRRPHEGDIDLLGAATAARCLSHSKNLVLEPVSAPTVRPFPRPHVGVPS